MMKVDHFKPTTVYTIYMASTPQTVWEAADAGGVEETGD
jgi:hypothetical protein